MARGIMQCDECKKYTPLDGVRFCAQIAGPDSDGVEFRWDACSKECAVRLCARLAESIEKLRL